MRERLGTIVDTYRQWFNDKCDIIVDAGTRDGDDAAWLAEQLRSDLVIAVDANPAAVKKTKLAYPDFTVVECALSDYDGLHLFEQIVSDRKDFVGSSSLVRYGDWGDVNSIEVVVKRFDTMMVELGSDVPVPLGVVKVDVEGFTWEFLHGMGDWLHHVGVFHLETEKFHRHEGHHDSGDVEEFMFGNGFVLVERSYEWGPTIEDQVWLNPRFQVV